MFIWFMVTSIWVAFLVAFLVQGWHLGIFLCCAACVDSFGDGTQRSGVHIWVCPGCLVLEVFGEGRRSQVWDVWSQRQNNKTNKTKPCRGVLWRGRSFPMALWPGTPTKGQRCGLHTRKYRLCNRALKRGQTFFSVSVCIFLVSSTSLHYFCLKRGWSEPLSLEGV